MSLNETFKLDESDFGGKKLWREYFKFPGSRFTDHLAIAQLVIGLLAFSCLLFIVWIHPQNPKYTSKDAAPRQKAFSSLELSMFPLFLFYIFRILNLLLAETQTSLRMGYFVTYIFTYGFLNSSNIWTIAIVCRISRLQLGRVEPKGWFNRSWRVVSGCLLTILVALALYSFAMFAAVWFITLQNIRGGVIDKFSKTQIKLDAALGILYIVTAVAVAMVALAYFVVNSKFREMPTRAEWYFFTVLVFLLIRSVADTHVVLNYAVHRLIAPKNHKVVEEALFGFPTVVIYFCLERLSLPASVSAVRSDILREGRDSIRKDFARRRTDVANGGPAMPTRGEMLKEMERQPLAYLPASTQSVIADWGQSEVKSVLSAHFSDVLAQCEKA